MKGKYRLLVLNGYKSYYSTDFELFYKDNNIITLYILAYSSYRLQLLNIGCFRALKKSYGAEIKKLMRLYITYVSKDDFFSVFYTAFYIIVIESNIRGGFRGARLVLYDPEYIIL